MKSIWKLAVQKVRWLRWFFSAPQRTDLLSGDNFRTATRRWIDREPEQDLTGLPGHILFVLLAIFTALGAAFAGWFTYYLWGNRYAAVFVFAAFVGYETPRLFRIGRKQ